MLVNDRDLSLISWKVNYLDAGGLSHNRDRESIIDKNPCDKSVWEANDECLLLGGTGNNFDKADVVFQDPLSN